MPERVAYRRAFDQGRTATETTFSSLNHKADALAQSIIDLITGIEGKRQCAGRWKSPPAANKRGANARLHARSSETHHRPAERDSSTIARDLRWRAELRGIL